MRKIIAITQLTLDGIMQGPGGPEEDRSNGFTEGGWAMSFSDAVLGQAFNEIMSREFDLLLGRRTYDIFASYWPKHDDNPIGKAFNKAKKHVATRTLTELDWNNSQPINGDVVTGLRKLKETDGPEIHIWGSGNLLQTLIAAELVDEFRMWTVPVVLSKGKRLFEDGLPPFQLELVDSIRTTKGVLMNTYRRVGPLNQSR